MSISRFIKWLHYEFPISCPAANWHTQYPAALAVDECRSSPGRCASEQCVTTDQHSGFKSPLTPMEIPNPFLCVALSEGEKWSSSPFHEGTSHPVSRLYCMYSMNIQTTPDRKTKTRLIPRGKQTCASPHKSLHFIYAVRFALLRTQPQYTKHYIEETQLIIVIAECLEATDVWKRQTTEDKSRNWGCFWQVLSRRWAKAVQGNQSWPLCCAFLWTLSS